MANLKDLKTRISSVKSTQKITKAMKMVAASRLRRAQESAEAARPYSSKLERMMATLSANVNPQTAPGLLVGRDKDKLHLMVIVSSDRGLCGGLNSSLVKEVKLQIEKCKANGQDFKLVFLGKKGYEALNSLYADNFAKRVDTAAKKTLEYIDAAEVADYAIAEFDKGEIDSCSVFFNKFVSPLVQDVTRQSLIPLDLETSTDDAEQSDVAYEFEPSEAAILEDLLPRNLAVQIYHAMLENSASEHASRMTAMDNATRNAGDMIDKLTLQYNRTRQAAITTELTEIISGAEAL